RACLGVLYTTTLNILCTLGYALLETRSTEIFLAKIEVKHGVARDVEADTIGCHVWVRDVFTGTGILWKRGRETSTFTTAPETSAAESSTIFFSASTTEDTTASTTLLTETTATTAADETNTEISSNTISTDAAESSLSTDITSLATTAETTTSNSATTTTTAPAPDVTCPSTRAQCFGSMNIKCGVFLVGITKNSLVDNLDECVRACAADAGCYGFSYMASQNLCFTAPSANTILGQRQSISSAMSFFSRVWSRLGDRAPLRPRVFNNPNFIRIPAINKIEEETLPDYLPVRYYPVRIGEVFVDRYQVVGKLGFGASSTVWLANDLSKKRHVALKVFIRSQALGEHVENEMNMYKRMEQRASNHPGRSAGPDGDHLVLAHPPLWKSIEAAIRRSSPRRLPPAGARYVLKDLFMALKYLHDEFLVDIKADNIMSSITDPSVFTHLEEEEIRDPCPRKEVEGRIIYTSRTMKSTGKVGPPVLCDFGSAVLGDSENVECVQPNVYRSPEVRLEALWDYKIYIWNVGCMVWDILEGNQLFHGIDPEHHEYRRRAHLAEIVALLGPPPKELLACGKLSNKFFSDEGTFIDGIDLPASNSLEEMETLLEGDEKKRFLEFMRKMLQWAPE
ncbi:unnamed protein product, partial [Fusarium graminearum]